MPEPEVIPEIKEILSALLFATREPLTPRQMVNVFKRTAEMYEGVEATFIDITVKDVTEALEELRQDLAGGFRMRNARHVGPWLRELLEKGKANKLSKPALETLSIIAYRQPVQRSEIESVRGVAADSIVRNLLDMGLVKVVGRSELPGKPWLYGTSQAFLEHFGLNSLDELPGMAEMRRNLEQRELALKEKEAAEQAEASDGPGEGEDNEDAASEEPSDREPREHPEEGHEPDEGESEDG
jgi:segregation and condensation protein B